MDTLHDIPVEKTQVLVVGASMVGMSLAALLAKHGITQCIAIEKHASTAIHPRAALFHPRTMQIYRELGLYDSMLEESLKHYDSHAGVFDLESLAGKFRGTWMANMNEGIESLSPVMRLYLTQQMFEPILRDKVISEGVDLRFSTEMLSFSPDSTGVSAVVRDNETGEKKLIRAQYMIACDGSRSKIRAALGIQMQGHGLLSHSLTIYFKANLGKYVNNKYNGVIYINNSVLRGFFRLNKEGTEGFLVVNTAGEEGTDESRWIGNNISDQRAAELLRAAIGADEPFEIILVAKWEARCDVANRYVDDTGRILLAGDAAHVNTPHGGFGGNTGIQDAHNLAWKLALVLKGQAGPKLVSETYEKERLPVARKTVAQVFERFIKRTAPDLRESFIQKGVPLEDEDQDSSLELGYRYHSQALDTEELDQILEDPNYATSRPGSMARHLDIWLDNGEKHPVADLIGHSFTMILASGADGWAKAIEKLRATEPINFSELRIYRLKKGTDDLFCSRYGIGKSGAVLIRPDGFVAWTAPAAAVSGIQGFGIPDSTTTLVQLMQKILCLEQPGQMIKRRLSVVSNFSQYSEMKSSMALSVVLLKRQEALAQQKRQLTKLLEQVDLQLNAIKTLNHLEDAMVMQKMAISQFQEGATDNVNGHVPKMFCLTERT
ncbi:4-methyl-5-nitrocatechol monooxygenase [Xylogone sp. PMI_703]|nr:4-methyl-5-nitrocatechol monooxygenase [Xylogone sp. PMI_703]